MLVGVIEVVGGGGANRGGQRRRAGVGQLLGVEPEPHAVRRRGHENPTGLIDVERPAVAEDVAEAGERGARREHLLDDEIDIGGRVGPSVGDMRQKRGDHVDRRPVAGRHRCLEDADLLGHRQAVARLGFDGGGTGPQHPLQPGGGGLDQGIGRRGTGRGDRGMDSASCRQDVLIAVAAEPPGELPGPLPSEHQMGVGIHEPGKHRSPGSAHHLAFALPGREVGMAPCPDDPPVGDDHCGIADQPEISARTWVGDQLADVGDQESPVARRPSPVLLVTGDR